jgi:hypothetical protein
VGNLEKTKKKEKECVCASICVCVCVCVCEREIWREGEERERLENACFR